METRNAPEPTNNFRDHSERSDSAQIRGPNAIHQIIGPSLVISAIRCFDTQIPTALGDSNPHGSALDLNEAPVVSLVLGEVCLARRHVSREHLPQFLDGAKIDLSRAIDSLDGVGVNVTNVLGHYRLAFRFAEHHAAFNSESGSDVEDPNIFGASKALIECLRGSLRIVYWLVRPKQLPIQERDIRAEGKAEAWCEFVNYPRPRD